jgi:hypothetical protein
MLTEKQRQAVILLLTPSPQTYRDCAKALGISERTLRRWRGMPDFRREIERVMEAIGTRFVEMEEERQRLRLAGLLDKIYGRR